MKQNLKMLTNIVKRLSDLMKKGFFTRHDSALFRHRWRLCSGNGPSNHLKVNFALQKVVSVIIVKKQVTLPKNIIKAQSRCATYWTF
jgi:hypothetical protein